VGQQVVVAKKETNAIMLNSALADLPVGKNETAAPTNKMIGGSLVGIMVDHCKIMIISEPWAAKLT